MFLENLSFFIHNLQTSIFAKATLIPWLSPKPLNLNPVCRLILVNSTSILVWAVHELHANETGASEMYTIRNDCKRNLAEEEIGFF